MAFLIIVNHYYFPPFSCTGTAMRRSKSTPSVPDEDAAVTTASGGGSSAGASKRLKRQWSYENIEDLPEEQDYFAKKLPQHLMKDDPSLNWFQKPHTITVMAIALIVLIFGAFTRDGADTVANAKVYVDLFASSISLPCSSSS